MDSGSVSKLPIEDELSLENINIPKLPSNIIFPEELNSFLRDQIKKLQHQNFEQKKTITDKDNIIKSQENRIKHLELKIKQLEHYTSLNTPDAGGKFQSSPSDVVAGKIVELSKKIRELTAEVESYKTKCSRLENKIKQYAFKEVSTPDISLEKEEKKDDDPDQIKQLSDKLAAMTKKFLDMKNQNIQLSNELKQANKILAQEIGDSFTSISNFAHSNHNSNWKGRAQQILSLQQKLTDFQERLSLMPMEKELSHNTIALRQIESSKKQLQEQTQKELLATKAQLDETKKKLDGSRARIKVLENEIAVNRARLNSLVEKNQQDERLITALTSENNLKEEKLRDKMQNTKKQLQRLQDDYNQVQGDLKQVRVEQENLKQTLAEREGVIHDLREQIKGYNRTLSVTNGRIKMNFNEHQNNEMEDENSPVYRAIDAERLRLLHMIANLNSNLDTTRNQLDEAQMNLKKEKQKLNKLENKLARLESEKITPRVPFNSYSRSNLKSNTIVTVSEKTDSSDLQNKLELAEEKILLLQSRVDALQEEKNIELENYNLMLENTKRIFQDELDGIRKKPTL